MSRICEGLRELMLDHALEELDGLKAARLDAHLVNCRACRNLHARLKEGLSAARNYEPEIGQDDIERMVAQVAPLFRESRGSWLPWLGLAVGGAAITAGMVFWLGSAVESPPLVVGAPPVAEVPQLPDDVVRKVFSPRLRMVASADFDGTLDETPGKERVLHMKRGFVVLHYDRGAARPLWVHAPGVRIKVLGTRFFVEVRSAAGSVSGTAVGVISGRVEVETRDRQELLPAGFVRSFTGNEAYTPPVEELRSPAYHHDPFLDQRADASQKAKRRRTVRRRSRPPSRAEPPPRVAAPSAEVARGLAEAEDLARKGRHAEALSLYGRLLERRSMSSEVRDLIRFERARLRARMGDRKAACETYDRLAEQARGEVRVQAALSECACLREKDPCAGLECFDRLATGEVPGAEMEAVRQRAMLAMQVICATHNIPEGVQQNQ